MNDHRRFLTTPRRQPAAYGRAQATHVRARGRAAVQPDLNAASPGVTTLFFRNEFYPSHEEYLFACADALRLEYEAIVASGVTLQIDCPDLAMGRHTQFAHLGGNGFRNRMMLHVEALNRALVNIPAEKRMHVCWGNYPGPPDQLVMHTAFASSPTLAEFNLT